MIIARYLTRQIMQLTGAIAFVLLVIAVLVRFLNYLAQASQGEMDPGVLVLLMSYRLPEFIQLILPLAFLLGILLAYGRMYAENEMTVLIATGLSTNKLLGITLVSAGAVALTVAVLALKVTPLGLVNSGMLLESQQDLNEFDVMVPGIFQSISGGRRTTYAETISDGVMREVFMSETANNSVTVAQSASLREDDAGNRMVDFRNGMISTGIPGEEEGATLTRFDNLVVVMPEREINFERTVEEKAMTTSSLLASGERAHMAELQWRFSLIVLIPVLVLMAIPLSRVSPRQGRFAKLAPAIMIYIVYFGLLLAVRDMIANNRFPAVPGLWLIHFLFLGVGLLMFFDRLRLTIPGLSR